MATDPAKFGPELFAKIGFDTAENGLPASQPAENESYKVLCEGIIRYYYNVLIP